MRIALICTEKLPVPPIRGGAVQLYISGILPYLARRHQVSVFSVADPSLPDQENDGIAEYVRVTARTPREYIGGISDVIKADDRRFDIIHVFNRPKWILELARELSEQGPRLTLSLHNDMFSADKITAEQAKTCLRLVCGVATVSDYIKNRVLELYPTAADRIRTIYSGADIEAFRPSWHPGIKKLRREVRDQLGIPADAPVYLSVGRLSPKKGIHILLNALPLVLAEHPRAALIVVGSKWYGKNESSSYISRLENAAAEFSGHAFFTGFVPPTEVPRFYAAADVFVCASQWAEPLARVHYEAMAAGLPIITTDRGGNAEVVRGFGNGWIVGDPHDPAEFARFISLLFAQPETARAMGENGRRLAEERFNWHKVAGAVEKLLFDALTTPIANAAVTADLGEEAG